MKKNFKWLVKNGHVYMLRRTIGIFGDNWECFGNFDNKDGNLDRCKQIIKQLNECAKNTEIFNND